MKTIAYILIYFGSALMAFNVYLYVRFARVVKKYGNWAKESRVLNFPIVLLILFLVGYLAVGIFGDPDLVIAGILFGGSIFVTVMLWLIKRAVERIKESDQLEVKLTAAEEANKAKTFFLSNMSHDLRTPLNAIIGFTALAKKDGVTLAEKDAFLGKIETAGNQLLDIVNDVLAMSRIENGRIEL